MSKVPELSVVVPLYNEQENLPELYGRLTCSLAALGVDYELIFVNDASTDGSQEILCREICERSDVRLINMSRNFGVSPCVLAGMQFAQPRGRVGRTASPGVSASDSALLLRVSIGTA